MRRQRLGLFDYEPGPGHDLSLQRKVEDLLYEFSNEAHLKELFWHVLGYTRADASLSCPPLAAGRERLVEELRLFCHHDGFNILWARVGAYDDRQFHMTLCHQLNARFAPFALILQSGQTSTLVLPDEQSKYYLRYVDLPGMMHHRAPTAMALAAFATFDSRTEEDRSRLEVLRELDLWFPGPTLPERDDITELRQYLQDINVLALLTELQEKMPGNQRQLVMHNLRLVVWIASKYTWTGNDIADMVQAGNLGLMYAAQRFDQDRGTRFSTYAYFAIDQHIRRFLEDEANIIRWPAYRARELLHCDHVDGHRLRAGERPVVSLDSARSRSESLHLADHTAQRDDDAKACCEHGMSRLSKKERLVLRWRYGLDDGDERTLEEMASFLRVSRERVRQIEASAEERMRLALKTCPGCRRTACFLAQLSACRKKHPVQQEQGSESMKCK